MYITNQSVIPSQHQFYLIPGCRTWTKEFLKAYTISGHTQVQPSSRTFRGKKQEKEEHLSGHLAVSSLLFRAKLVLEPLVKQYSVHRLLFFQSPWQ